MDIAESTPIDGEWINELGSNVTFKLSNGFITGRYKTVVVSNSDKNNVPPETPLYGSYTVVDDGILLTFNVQWKFTDNDGTVKYSTTAWIGKYFTSDKIFFDTTWLLQSNNKKEESWAGIRTNKDRFTHL